MTGPYVIGCDVGSQGTNAALYAADGRLVAASAYEAYDVSFPHPTWAEQDPRLWTAALEAAIQLLAQVPEGPSAVKGLSFGSQLDGMVVCDAKARAAPGDDLDGPAGRAAGGRRGRRQAVAGRLLPPHRRQPGYPTPSSRPCGSATPSPRCSPRPST